MEKKTRKKMDVIDHVRGILAKRKCLIRLKKAEELSTEKFVADMNKRIANRKKEKIKNETPEVKKARNFRNRSKAQKQRRSEEKIILEAARRRKEKWT